MIAGPYQIVSAVIAGPHQIVSAVSCRHEFEVHDDPDSKLQLKGVVYNEMKGAMQSHGSRYMRGELPMLLLYYSSCFTDCCSCNVAPSAALVATRAAAAVEC